MRQPPKTCPRCRSRPVAYPQALYCYDCRPHGVKTPPPCRKCGSNVDYYSGGLCRPCHPAAGAPPWIEGPDSCVDCLGWGLHHTGICPACQSWRRHHGAKQGPCLACGRSPLALRGDWCRLCWKQAGHANPDPHAALNPMIAGRRGQQLFLTFPIPRPREQVARAPRSSKGTWRLAPPVFRAPVAESVGPDQPALPGLPDLVAVPPIGVPDPVMLAQVFEHVDRLATERGWRAGSRKMTRSGLRLALAHYRAETLTADRVEMLAERYGFSRIGRARVIDVLHDAGVVVHDRAGRIERWLTRHTGQLPNRCALSSRGGSGS